MDDLNLTAVAHFKPIVSSLMDTDFYKLLMLQFVWKNYLGTNATFALTNRTKTINILDDVDVNELKKHLDHVKQLRFTPTELFYLKGSEFGGMKNVFSDGFLSWLKYSFKLSDYTIDTSKKTLELSFGTTENNRESWAATMMWEIYAMAIVNELRYKKIMSNMTSSEIDLTYAQAKVKLHKKIKRLKTVDGLKLTDFGTRRRHSQMWQEYCIQMLIEHLGEKFTGTSNLYLAMKYNIPAIGTNAHELPMILSALAKDDAAIKESQYKVLQQWQNMYRERLLCFLPDTFGTTQFLKHAPIWVYNWAAGRPDSKDPYVGGEELIAFWDNYRRDMALEKTVVFADGLDVKIDGYECNGDDIVAIQEYFKGRVGTAYGWGTNLTNDFRECAPEGFNLNPISIVCKPTSADGKPTVKLSDNANKRTGDAATIEKFVAIFGEEGVIQKTIKV